MYDFRLLLRYIIIAYHVGLNAVLGWPQGIRPKSKKNSLLSVASSYPLVVNSDLSSYFLVGRVICSICHLHRYLSPAGPPGRRL